MRKVLKFGGSSLATAQRIASVAKIILQEQKTAEVIVVVSAFHGVTNELITAAKKAALGDKTYIDIYQALVLRHHETLNQLIQKKISIVDLDTLLYELEDSLQGIYLLRECSLRSLDMIASFGERLSAKILSMYLNAEYVDARHLVVTDDQFTKANVNFAKTNTAIQQFFQDKNQLAIVTGFIGKTENGQTSTIGRNGSDYSAAIFGSALGVSEIQIWTDVDGIYTADPREVEHAYVIPHLSYEEALELSHFGAKVLHSATIAPAVTKEIPILIKNTFNPDARGTLISQTIDKTGRGVKGISSFANVTLLTLRGINMVGVPGTAERLFRTLANKNVNIILICQASSEHTICFAIRDEEVDISVEALSQEFRYELNQQLMLLEKKPAQTIIAVVGENMIGTPGVAGKFCYALGQHRININAIAQGASERNISLAINTKDSHKALNTVHQFFFEKIKSLALCVIGVGKVGAALLSLIEQQKTALLAKGYRVSVVAIANSKQLLFNPHGLDLKDWQTNLKNSDEHFSIARLSAVLKDADLSSVALIDCTASMEVVKSYPDFIEQNIHVVTPNKNANVLPWDEYQSLMQLLQKKQCHFLFEANVGAGLPIISTLQDLMMGGDSVMSIEGILSGTLSYLFNQYNGTIPFSEIIRQAHTAGFTEPDPREDLSGNDVARKLLILARLLDRKMDFNDVTVESLIPENLRTGKFHDNFYQKFDEFDHWIKEKFENARKKQCVLRYVGTLDATGAKASLKEIPEDHPLARTQGSDNVIVFTTERYAKTPLVIQGPGAGATVTAMGVFSDIYKLLHYLKY